MGPRKEIKGHMLTWNLFFVVARAFRVTFSLSEAINGTKERRLGYALVPLF